MKSTLFGWGCTLTLLIVSLAFAVDQTSRHQEGLRENVPAVYALTHARIVLDSQSIIEDGTLVIEDGKVAAVGSDVEVPSYARVLDFTGRVVYPGFIDGMSTAEVPLSEEDNAVYWNRQISPERRVATRVESDDEAWRKAGFAVRLVAPNDGIIRGQSALLLTSDQPFEDRILKADVFQHARLTVSRGGGRDNYPNSPMGAVALARQAMYDAQWYGAAHQAVKADTSLPAPEWNRSLAALQPLMSQQQSLVVDTSNEIMALRADRFAREFGVSLILNGSGNEYRRLESIAETGRVVLLPVDFPKPPNVATPESAARATLEQLMHWDLAPENPGRLYDAGVRFALTTQGLSSPSEFWEQVRKAVERGLPESVALDAITVVPAQLCGMDDQVGTIAKGKVANLVVFDESPFTEKAELLETWVKGQRFEIKPEKDQKAAGVWSIQLSRNQQINLNIKGTDDRLSAEAFTGAVDSEEPETQKLSQIGIHDYRLSALLPGKMLDQEGVVQLTLILDPKNTNQAEGFLLGVDGQRRDVTAIKNPEADSAEEEKDGNDESAEEAPSEPEESEGEKLNIEGEQKGSARRSSFAVNYPLGAYGRTASPEQSDSIVFRNLTVWTCGDAGIIEEGDVLVVSGKIQAIGVDLEVPEGTVEVDGEGMHLTPGIIDCHSHMATDGGVNESAQAITAEVRIGDFVDCDDITIYRQLAGGVTAANILHGSANPIGGQNQVIKLRWGQLDEEMKFDLAPAGIKFALGENVKQANWGDDYTTRYPQTRMGVEQIMRDEFRAAKAYDAAWQAWNERREGLPPRRDLELDAVAEIVNGERWIHCHSYRQDEILALIRTLDDFGIQIGSFQHILEGYKVADAMARHGAMGSAFSDWWAYKFEVVDAIPYAGALMHDAGVVVSFNSDDRELARHLNQEAAKAVKYGGVSPEEALKFVTLNPAKQLRIDQYVGSIEEGKHADLVLWSASPLSNFARCEQTWIEGAKYFDRQDDLAARNSVAEMRRTLIQKILASGEQMNRPGEGKVDPASLWPREDLFCHAHGHDGEEHGHDHE